MTTATIAVGTRVRVNASFGIPPANLDPSEYAVFKVSALEYANALGKTGVVVEIFDDPECSWPIYVKFDDAAYNEQLMMDASPLAAHELDVIDSE